MWVKKQQLEPCKEQLPGSELIKYNNTLTQLFNSYAENILWNAGLDELQAGIKFARRNINSFRYRDDTTLMAENKEELKILLMRVKEEDERAGLSLSIKKEMKLRPWHPVPLLHGK